MPIHDNEYLAKEQAVTEASTASTNTVNTNKVKNSTGNQKLNVVCQVVEAFANLTDITVEVEHSDDDQSFSLAGVSSGAVASAPLGTILLAHALPDNLKKYVRLKLTVNGTSVTGKITAYMTPYLDSFLAGA